MSNPSSCKRRPFCRLAVTFSLFASDEIYVLKVSRKIFNIYFLLGMICLLVSTLFQATKAQTMGFSGGPEAAETSSREENGELLLLAGQV